MRGRNSDYIEAEKYLALCRMGKMRAVKEHDGWGARIICVSNSGKTSKVIKSKYAYMFEAFMLEYGNRDGLFEGCDQTAEVK